MMLACPQAPRQAIPRPCASSSCARMNLLPPPLAARLAFRFKIQLPRVSRSHSLRRPLPPLRSSDLKEHGPTGDEWRPPSDWDHAWAAYKKVSSSSTPTPSVLNKGCKAGMGAAIGSRSPNASGSSSSSSSAGAGTGTPLPRPRRLFKESPLRHMEQYVSRNPNHSDFPLVEETDPLRRTERRALDPWADTKFTYAGFGVIAVMFVYMVVIVGPPPA